MVCSRLRSKISMSRCRAAQDVITAANHLDHLVDIEDRDQQVRPRGAAGIAPSSPDAAPADPPGLGGRGTPGHSSRPSVLGAPSTSATALIVKLSSSGEPVQVNQDRVGVEAALHLDDQMDPRFAIREVGDRRYLLVIFGVVQLS